MFLAAPILQAVEERVIIDGNFPTSTATIHARFQIASFGNAQGFIALLHFVPVQLKSLKPKETDFEPRTLGEHIRRRRLEMELTQKEVADQFGVVSWTVRNWEKGRTQPLIKFIPTIVGFLGYDPFPQPTNLSKH